MKRNCCLLSLFLLLFVISARSQPGKVWPKTLLWRISGNGLTKNSFLYGTMHVQDKRVFNFGDSLYHYLKQADGYALEIDMQEFLDSVIQKVVDEKQSELFDEYRMSEKDKKKIIDSLVANVKLKKDKASQKQLEQMRNQKMRRLMKNKEMPTFMDAFLYGIAKRQGKWLGGIEDVQDQLSLLDEFGGDISSDEILAPDKEIVSSLERMIEIYRDKDLAALDLFCNGNYSKDYGDRLILKRNIKMARRMDSLAHQRSMFFAVGAAHLPGDSGVLNLLKGRGYSVEPVLSPQTIDPLKYVEGLSSLPWTKVEDGDKTYEIEMPGKSSELSLLNDFFKMKYYFDITTMTFFMSGSTRSQQGMDLEKIKNNFTKNVNGEIISSRSVSLNGVKGSEAVVSANGNFYRVQFFLNGRVLYMIMAGGSELKHTENADVKRFLSSLVMMTPAPVPEEEVAWSKFALDGKGFEIQFPGKPKQNRGIEKKAEGTEWKFDVYDYADTKQGIYYMVQVRELRPGYYLTGDSSYFSLLKENMKGSISKPIKDVMTEFQGFPAYHYEGSGEDPELFFKTFNINRGNRVYTIFVGGSNEESNLARMEQYVRSFNLIPYVEAPMKQEMMKSANFSTFAPEPISEPTKDSSDQEIGVKDTGERHFLSYDKNTCISYEIFTRPIEPYYWVASDSLYFDGLGLQYKKSGDSVLSRRMVKNGGQSGMEWVFKLEGNNNRKKIRQLANGDTVYTLISFIASQYVEEEPQRAFFEKFRFDKEISTAGLYQSKAAQLLNDLRSLDSATRERALGAVDDAPFTSEDLPLLHQALMAQYPDDSLSDYTATRSHVSRILRKYSDSSTVDFIRKQYDQLKDRREALKMTLLDVLAENRTAYSYSLLKELLIRHTPRETRGVDLSYWVEDSLALARTLYPELLELTGNTLFAERVIDISNQLIDSSLITLEMLRPYQENIMHTADTIVNRLKGKKVDDDYYSYYYYPVLHLLQKFNEAKANAILAKYLGLADLALNKEAALGLAHNKQVVAPAVWLRIAADKAFRRDLWDSLQAMKAMRFFPVKYLTQQALAESDMYAYADDDEDSPTSIKYLGERVTLYKGVKKKFFLFKVTYSYEDDEGEMKNNEYLGVTGPYSLNAADMKTDFEATGQYFDEEFNATKVNVHFGKYLKKVVEYSGGE